MNKLWQGPSDDRRPRRLGRVVTAAVAMASCLVGVVAVEALIRSDPRWLPPSWQIRTHTPLLAQEVVPDPEVGFLLLPNQSERVETRDFSFLRQTDSQGFRNRDPWPTSADIVVLGDSLVAGVGVPFEATFTSLIDDALADERVINLGVHGAGPERQYRIYRRFGAPLQPRLVLACLYLASDLVNDDRFRQWLQEPEGLDYQSYRLGYRWRNDTRPMLVRRLENQRLFGWLQAIVEPNLWEPYRIIHRVVGGDGAVLFLDRTKVRFAKGPMAATDPHLDHMMGSLVELGDLVETQGAALAVVLIPSKEELYAVALDAVAGTPIDRVRHRLREAGIAFLDLYPILRERSADQTLYFTRDIHLNEAGNRVVAEVILDWKQDRATIAHATR